MKQYLLVTLAALLHCACAMAGPGETPSSADLLRTFRKLQDEAARGDTTARQFQEALADQLAKSFGNPLANLEEMPDWSATVIGYSLSGAPPKLARRLLATVKSTDRNYQLAMAAREYADGNMKAAMALFDGVSAVGLDPRIAPYFMLAWATSRMEADIKKSASGFELATLHGSGTLVEEVALRRLAMIGEKMGDGDIFRRSTNLYIRRYANSPYADQFFAHFAEHAPHLLSHETLAEFISIVDAQRPEFTGSIFLAVAEAAALAGKTELVADISARLQSPSVAQDKQGSERLKLYEFIASFSNTNKSNSSPSFPSIDAALISQNEKMMFGKLSATVSEISKPLSIDFNDTAELAGKIFERKMETNSNEIYKSSDMDAREFDNESNEIFKKLDISAKLSQESIERTNKLLID